MIVKLVLQNKTKNIPLFVYWGNISYGIDKKRPRN